MIEFDEALGEGPLVPLPTPHLVPIEIVSDLWTRCIVDVGHGSRETKIYFDNCSHQSGKQRGWVENGRMGTIKYEFVQGDKAMLCAKLYLWCIAGDALDPEDRANHLAYSASEADVARILLSLRMRPF